VNYPDYTTDDCTIKEYYITMSDGVQLKIIDFIPGHDSENKPLILFVAGWISLISGWKDVLKIVTPQYRTIYIETREKNSSKLPRRGKVSFTIERLVADLEETINTLISPKRGFIFCGSSLGATTILEYMASGERQPQCAILIGPNGEFRFPRGLGHIIPALHPSLYSIVKPVVKWYLKNFRLDPEKDRAQMIKYENTLDAADPYKLKPNAIAIRNYKIWDKLPSIAAPTIMIGATTDKLHGSDNLQRMVSLMPHARYTEFSSNTETHSVKAGEYIAEIIRTRRYLEI